jgi:XRE family transcriptional regulator, regulator of sulfur utilization
MDELQKKKIDIDPGHVIRQKREQLGFKGVELAKRAGINPGTLDAIEKGRIKSPSLKNLNSIACAMNISMAALFVNNTSGDGELFVGGNQKGQHTIEFPKEGLRIVSYVPIVPTYFIGKVIIKGETRIEHKTLPTSGMIFVQTIMGKISIEFEGKDYLIREGNYVFFDGCFQHSFYNPHYKESTFLLVSSPSFLSSNP